MRPIYHICCGLDVHKNVIAATIVTTDKTGIFRYIQRSFSTINSDIQKFHNWLIENDCEYVCMKSSEKNRIQNCMTELSSTIILAEIGINMNIFDDAKHLCSWCGLSPANNQSAGKKKSVRIAKAVQYLKPMMVQCALAAIRSKKEPYFAIKYGRIKKRRGHKKTLLP